MATKTKTLNTRIVSKHDTEANWNRATSFIPKKGEIIIYDPDDDYDYPRVKIGDGTTAVTSLDTLDSNVVAGLNISGLTIQGKNADGDLVGDSITIPTASASVSGVMTSAQFNKLEGVSANANNYSLPNATSSTLGGVKIGSNITVSSGKISLTKSNVTSALGYTPPTTNTTYSDATATTHGLMSTADKSKLDGISANANKYELPVASTDLGGVKTISEVTDPDGYVPTPIIDGIPYYKDTNTTYGSATTSGSGLMTAAMVTKLNGIATGATNYTHPSFTSKTSGLYKITVNSQGHVSAATAVAKSDITALGIPGTNTTYGVATTDDNGLMSAGDKSKLDNIDYNANNYSLPAAGSTLGGVKTTSTVTDPVGYTSCPIISGVPYYKDTNTTYNDATTSTHGLMSTSDKSKLDGIASGANKYSLPVASSSTLGGVKTGSNITNSSGTISLTKSNVTNALGYTPVNSAMSGASSSAAGSTGLVPAPAKGEQGLYLRGDGEWATPTNTTYGTATSSSNGLMSSTDKSKLDGIASGANKYSLPTASSSTLGGVKTGSNITNSSGTISITKSNVTNALGYTPPTTNTTYDVFTGPDDKTGDDGTSGLVPAPAYGDQTLYLKGDGTWSTPTNTTYGNATTSSSGLMSSSDKSKLDGISSGANKYSLPNATSSTLGGVKIGSNITVSSGTISLSKSNVTSALGYTPPTTNTTYSEMGGASSSAAGSSGLVPAPAKGEQEQYLRGDGEWATPTNTTYSDATTSAHGLMTAAMVTKLNGIATNANNYSHPTSSGNKHIPSGGSSGQILRWSSDGTAAWGSDNNTTYGVATTSANGLMSSTDKSKLDGIASGANNYSLPTASSSTLGGVKVGSNITLSSGTISLSKSNVTAALGYTPPTTDTNTTYSAGTGISLSGTKFSNSGVRSISTGTSNGTISVNTNGSSANVAVKGLGSAAYTSSSDYADSDHEHTYLKNFFPGGNPDGRPTSLNFNMNSDAYANKMFYSLATSACTEGKPPQDSVVITFPWDSSGWASQMAFQAEPNPHMFIRGAGADSNSDSDWDSSWRTVLDSANFGDYAAAASHGHSNATTSSAGFMSTSDKSKLDGISSGANKYTLPSATSSTLGGVKIGSNISVSSGTISLSKSNVTAALGYTPPTTNTTYSVMGAASSSAAGSSGLVPAPAAGEQAQYLRGDGEWATPTDTNTTYSAGTGISLSGTKFSNSGVRSISTGSSNGTISVNTGGTTSSVSVKGLGTAAYTSSTAYAASSHTHSYLPLSGGTTTGTTTLASHLKVAYESSTVKIYFVS